MATIIVAEANYVKTGLKTSIGNKALTLWRGCMTASIQTFVPLNTHVLCIVRIKCWGMCVFQLLAVVSELQRQGLCVLVLGRKHMLQPSRSWDKHNMSLIQQKAHCFFTDNMWAPDNEVEYYGTHFLENTINTFTQQGNAGYLLRMCMEF